MLISLTSAVVPVGIIAPNSRVKEGELGLHPELPNPLGWSFTIAGKLSDSLCYVLARGDYRSIAEGAALRLHQQDDGYPDQKCFHQIVIAWGRRIMHTYSLSGASIRSPHIRRHVPLVSRLLLNLLPVHIP